MKRLLPVLLAALLLTGCGSSGSSVPTEPTQTQTTPPVKLVSLYDAKSAVEQQTSGAVRAYPLGDGAYTGLMTMGQKLLVASADGSLTVLQGEMGEVAATGITNLSDQWNAGDLIAGENGVMYYAEASREVVRMNAQLQELQRIALPEQSQGRPVIQHNAEVFYCVDSEIRALNIGTGITRLVRQHSCVSQELTGSFFNDTVIGCRITDEEGSQRVVYLYAETGEVIHTDTEGFCLQAEDASYIGILDGEEKEYIFGSLHEEPMCLYPKEETVAGALALGGAVGYTASEEGLALSFYDFATGKRTGAVTLQGIGAPQAVTADESHVWLTVDGILYRWDVSATPVAEETVYADLRYTADQPDTAGLAQCQSRVQKIRDTYGLNLYIWEEAKDLAGDYTLEEEYRVSVIDDSLNRIEELLRQFPEGFLQTTGDVSVYLVQSLESGELFEQYWDSKGCHVVISSEDVGKAFLIGLGFAVDTRVLGNSRDFDTWDDLNPRRFEYTYDYEANTQREDAEDYLDSFIDQQAMSFPTEDRSRIFAYAVLPEGGAYFEKEDLQEKLLRLCEGIREAYGLEDSTEVFIWEQYLDEPIAEE